MGRKKEFTNRTRLTVLLDEDELSDLAEAAEKEGQSMSRLARAMIRRYIRRWKARRDAG